jgi:hypothetical protein
MRRCWLSGELDADVSNADLLRAFLDRGDLF